MYDDEIWVVVNINGIILEDYLISSYGRLRSIKYGHDKFLNGSINNKGYILDKFYTVDKDGDIKKINSQRHRTVLQSFNIPQPPGCDQVDHINGIKTDNSLINLEWVDCKTNIQRSWETGLHKNDVRYGEKSPNHKYNEEDVNKAFELKIEGYKNSEIAKITGIKRDSLYRMFIGETWNHVYEKYKDELIKVQRLSKPR